MLPSLLLLATAAVAAPTHAQIASADWKELGIKKHADAGRVDIYRSKIEGFDCYAASATADGDAEVRLAILSDPSQATEWTSTDLSEAVVLSRGSAGTEYYQHLTLPGWMFVADRFWFAVGNIVRTDDEISWNYQKLEDPNAHGEARAAHRQRHPKAIELEMAQQAEERERLKKEAGEAFKKNKGVGN